jgi:hypothetical protein
MRHRSLPAVGALAILIATSGAPAAPAAASAPAGSAPGAAAVALAPRTVPARPGFRRTPSGPVLDVARFTTVGTLDVPAAAAARSVVLQAQLRVSVPIRIALSVRAWCATPSAMTAAPDRRSLGDVLVIGQNPVPGRAATEVASRSLIGRAVVAVPAGGRLRCTLQISPRTESTTGSTLHLDSGRFTVTPARVAARAAQRPAVLVGAPGAPGLPTPAPGVSRSRAVAILGPVGVAGAVRLEGEAELTTCALGYHLCGRGRAPASVVDVVLVLAELRADGRVCRTWRGSSRRVTITSAVHHVKVMAPALTAPSRCGDAVRGHLLVTHRGGNAVEVEPVLLDPGHPVRVQTHVWLHMP